MPKTSILRGQFWAHRIFPGVTNHAAGKTTSETIWHTSLNKILRANFEKIETENHQNPHWLNISKTIFRENKKNRFFPGWGPSLSDRSPPKTYSEKFSAKFHEAFRSVARSRNPRPPMKIRPRRDRSGWFLIEKTTILTNSCCLHVQPTFGDYARGSAFGVALRTEGWLFVWPAVWQAAVLYHLGVCTCARFS